MKNQSLLIILLSGIVALLLINQQNSISGEFESWKNQFGITYASKFQDIYRQKVFNQNLAKIRLHNANQENTYKMGLNQFSALTQQQFVQQYLGTIFYKIDKIEKIEKIVKTSQINSQIDWRAKGAVTSVKNQGNCGSCWAFSTTGGLEGLSKIRYGSLQSFSEQQLVDCSGAYGNSGCNGGLMDNAYKFVQQKGILQQKQYPYVAVKQECVNQTGPFKISGFVSIKNCNDMGNELLYRPLSVSVDASNWSAYKSGIFGTCGQRLNHGALLVGVTDNYWLVKNSWGSSWGQLGYIRLTRGNTCGICNVVSYPNK